MNILKLFMNPNKVIKKRPSDEPGEIIIGKTFVTLVNSCRVQCPCKKKFHQWK